MSSHAFFFFDERRHQWLLSHSEHSVDCSLFFNFTHMLMSRWQASVSMYAAECMRVWECVDFNCMESLSFCLCQPSSSVMRSKRKRDALLLDLANKPSAQWGCSRSSCSTLLMMVDTLCLVTVHWVQHKRLVIMTGRRWPITSSCGWKKASGVFFPVFMRVFWMSYWVYFDGCTIHKESRYLHCRALPTI